MKKCKLVQNIMNFKFCYIIFCTIICFIVLSVPASAKENSDNVIRVGSFEETLPGSGHLAACPIVMTEESRREEA